MTPTIDQAQRLAPHGDPLKPRHPRVELVLAPTDPRRVDLADVQLIALDQSGIAARALASVTALNMRDLRPTRIVVNHDDLPRTLWGLPVRLDRTIPLGSIRLEIAEP